MNPKFKKFISYYKPYKGIIIADLICAFLSAGISIIIPLVISFITGDLIESSGITEANMQKILIHLGVLVVLLVVEYFAQYYVTYIGHHAGSKMEANLRSELFGHYQKLSFTFYDENKTGQLMSRLTNDLFSLTELYHHGPEDVIISLVKLVGSFTILMFVNWKLTLILFSIIPFIILFILVFNRKMNKIFKENKKAVAIINEQVEDNLSGIRVVKSFTNEEREEEKFEVGNQKLVETKRVRYKLMGSYHSTLNVFAAGLQVLVIIIGSLIIYFKLTYIEVDEFLLFLLLVGNLTGAVRQFIAFFETFQEGWTGFERFYDLMDVKEEPYDNPNAIELKDVKGHIEFKNVTFNYKTSRKGILEHFDMTVNPGDYVALVGESGVGKSTICSLIPRFYDPLEGDIFLDGVNIKDIKLSSLRSKIGIVQQDVYLFNGNVYDNINYGDLDATEEEIKEAAVKANADQFIQELPNGYLTDIGQRGVRLSGGQKQRLSIARVFLKNPPILIFDEATSSLDNESECVIQQSLEELAKGRTTIVIAHRLTTIINAKVICVVGEKGIVEVGNHEELMKKNGVYAKLYNRHL